MDTRISKINICVIKRQEIFLLNLLLIFSIICLQCVLSCISALAWSETRIRLKCGHLLNSFHGIFNDLNSWASLVCLIDLLELRVLLITSNHEIMIQFILWYFLGCTCGAIVPSRSLAPGKGLCVLPVHLLSLACVQKIFVGFPPLVRWLDLVPSVLAISRRAS